MFTLVVVTLLTRLSTLPRIGSQHGGPVKRRQKEMVEDWRGGVRSVWDPPLLDTENEAEGD